MADNGVCQNLREVESISKEKRNRSRGEDCDSKQGLALEHYLVRDTAHKVGSPSGTWDRY